jgi:P27 family predicted phage terminase small subunit
LVGPAPDVTPYFRHPMILIQRQAADEMSRAGGELGLSPLARTRLTVEKKEDDDPLNLFLDGRNEGAYLPLQDDK